MTTTNDILNFFDVLSNYDIPEENNNIKSIIHKICERQARWNRAFTMDDQELKDKMTIDISDGIKRTIAEAQQDGDIRRHLEFTIAYGDASGKGYGNNASFPFEVIVVVGYKNSNGLRRFSCIISAGANSFSVSNEVVMT